MKILLVEDDKGVGDFICTYLKIWKQETLLAKDGEETWQLLQNIAEFNQLVQAVSPAVQRLTIEMHNSVH